MIRRTFLAFLLAAAAVGGAALGSARAARPCPPPNCPLIGCPPCTALVCDPGHCRMHCERIAGCEP